LFVIDGAQGRGYGTALLDAALAQLRQAGNRQAVLTTDPETLAARFYAARGWIAVGENLDREVVYRIPL
jgi:GNAT superfamily N-acetyltransferase